MLYHDHAHNLVGCTSCSDALACNAKTYKQIYLSTAGKGVKSLRCSSKNLFLFRICFGLASINSQNKNTFRIAVCELCTTVLLKMIPKVISFAKFPHRICVS